MKRRLRVRAVQARKEVSLPGGRAGRGVDPGVVPGCSLSAGLVADPDFASLTITAGGAAGLPSPGLTTLSEQPDGRFLVDSFFDLSYEVAFTGAPGGQLHTLSGSNQGRVGLVASERPIFADGFESGDTGAWNYSPP